MNKPLKPAGPKSRDPVDGNARGAKSEAIGTGLPPFSGSLPMQLMRAREHVMQRFRPHLRSHGLTEQQWRIIRALVEVESLEILDLSRRCAIHPASLSRILPKLDEQKVIKRRTSEEDQRRTIVSLAPGGRKLFEQIIPESQAIYAKIERELGPTRLKTIYRVLDELISILAAAEGVAEFEE